MGSVSVPQNGITQILSGQMAGNTVVATGTTSTVMNIPLGTGTWLVNIGISVESGTTFGAVIESTVVQGTATAAISGQVSASECPNVADVDISLALQVLVIVTVAGSLAVKVTNNNTGGCTVKTSTSGTGTYGNATGWVAIGI